MNKNKNTTYCFVVNGTYIKYILNYYCNPVISNVIVLLYIACSVCYTIILLLILSMVIIINIIIIICTIARPGV